MKIIIDVEDYETLLRSSIVIGSVLEGISLDGKYALSGKTRREVLGDVQELTKRMFENCQVE
jgi:hypothetical protein